MTETADDSSSGTGSGVDSDIERKRRPGGRSARVRAAVLEATMDALRKQGTEFSIPELAARAGVHDATIYRRWGTREALILDAVSAHVGEEIPIPDSGSLRGDLLEYVRQSVTFLGSPLGSLLVRATATGPSTMTSEARRDYWLSRFARVAVLFERALVRGEIPASADVRLAMEMLVAPLYFRLLVSHDPLDDDLAARIVDLVLDGISATAGNSRPGLPGVS